MSISEGAKLPEATLTVMADNGPQPVSSNDLLGTGLVVLFAVPGAFTPTCSAQHLPSFLEQAEALGGKGVDRLVCMAVNDVFVMDAWGKSSGAGSTITMAADGNGEFTKALGLEMDATAFGMGIRSQRFALIIRDGVIEKVLVEAPGEYRVSSAEYVLDQI
ncbi:MAG: peroxiredoxin [Wenzhouxiangella sp.]|jgi:peroxiredoxin|nr:peroxiredoxin [Wenzhouxiangella sp.]